MDDQKWAFVCDDEDGWYPGCIHIASADGVECGAVAITKVDSVGDPEDLCLKCLEAFAVKRRALEGERA